MSDALHSPSIQTIFEHFEYLLELRRYHAETGDLAMASQIVEDFNAAMARLFASHDAKAAEAAGSVDLKQQIAFLQGQLDSEQAKAAEMEKSMTDATAAANSRSPAA